MELDGTLRKHQEIDREQVGLRRAMVYSIGLHVLALGLLIFFGVRKPERKPLPSITVGITNVLPQSQGGKKTKAAVARNPESKPKPKPKAKPPAKKPTEKTVGLNKESKKTTKKETAAPAVETKPSPVEVEKEKMDRGGTGGVNETGASLNMAFKGDPNAPRTEFSDYNGAILAELSNYWTRGSYQGRNVIVTFNILRDGSVEGARVTESSGQSFLDSPAIRAVLASRFPPLPQGFKGEKYMVNVTFDYSK